MLLLAGSLFLAGCSGGGSKYDTGAMDSVSMGGVRNQAMAVPETTAAAYDYAMEEPEGEEGWVAETAAETEDARQLTSSSDISRPPSSARKLIRTISMNVETDDFDGLISQLQSKVAQLSGYIEQSDISGSSITYGNMRPDRYASMTARIPSNKLDSFIAAVESGGNVTNKSESTQDVTLQYSDLESRKKTLSMEQERIWSLLEKADTLEAVIALEERLSEIRYELESMESRLKLYDNQVEYSTINISIHEVLPADFTPVAPESVAQRIKKGFAKNVENVSEALTDLLIGVIAGIPLWLPLLIGLALILAAARRVRKKRKGQAAPLFRFFRKNPKTAAPSGPLIGGSHKTDTSDKDETPL